jgi:hypothetical protein
MPPDDRTGYWAAVTMLAMLAAITGIGFGMFPDLGPVLLALDCLVLGMGWLGVVAIFLLPAGSHPVGEQPPTAHVDQVDRPVLTGANASLPAE